MGPAEKGGREREKEDSREYRRDAFKARRYRCLLFATRVARAPVTSTNQRTKRQTDWAADRPTNRPSERTSNRRQTGYTPYEKKSIVNEPLVLSFSLPLSRGV